MENAEETVQKSSSLGNTRSPHKRPVKSREWMEYVEGSIARHRTMKRSKTPQLAYFSQSIPLLP